MDFPSADLLNYIQELHETYLDKPFREAMTWLNEIVPQIEAVVKRKQVTLPKTPSQRAKKRGRAKITPAMVDLKSARKSTVRVTRQKARQMSQLSQNSEFDTVTEEDTVTTMTKMQPTKSVRKGKNCDKKPNIVFIVDEDSADNTTLKEMDESLPGPSKTVKKKISLPKRKRDGSSKKSIMPEKLPAPDPDEVMATVENKFIPPVTVATTPTNVIMENVETPDTVKTKVIRDSDKSPNLTFTIKTTTPAIPHNASAADYVTQIEFPAEVAKVVIADKPANSEVRLLEKNGDLLQLKVEAKLRPTKKSVGSIVRPQRQSLKKKALLTPAKLKLINEALASLPIGSDQPGTSSQVDNILERSVEEFPILEASVLEECIIVKNLNLQNDQAKEQAENDKDDTVVLFNESAEGDDNNDDNHMNTYEASAAESSVSAAEHASLITADFAKSGNIGDEKRSKSSQSGTYKLSPVLEAQSKRLCTDVSVNLNCDMNNKAVLEKLEQRKSYEKSDENDVAKKGQKINVPVQQAQTFFMEKEDESSDEDEDQLQQSNQKIEQPILASTTTSKNVDIFPTLQQTDNLKTYVKPVSYFCPSGNAIVRKPSACIVASSPLPIRTTRSKARQKVPDIVEPNKQISAADIRPTGLPKCKLPLPSHTVSSSTSSTVGASSAQKTGTLQQACSMYRKTSTLNTSGLNGSTLLTPSSNLKTTKYFSNILSNSKSSASTSSAFRPGNNSNLFSTLFDASKQQQKQGPSNLAGSSVMSFIKRNTPLKPSQQEVAAQVKEKIEAQEAKYQEVIQKKEEYLRMKAEESKKKREEREQKVAAAKEAQKQQEDVLKRKIDEKHQSTVALKELEAKKLKERKQAEAEAIRKKAEEEAKRKIEEEARKLHKQKELQETAEKQRQKEFNTASSSTAPKPKPTRTTFNKADEPAKNPDTYDMTPPAREKTKCKAKNDYGIDDLSSGDETDDAEAPRKSIPSWAQGPAFKGALVSQYYETKDTGAVFGRMVRPDLKKIFGTGLRKARVRTSSAEWKNMSFIPFDDSSFVSHHHYNKDVK